MTDKGRSVLGVVGKSQMVFERGDRIRGTRLVVAGCGAIRHAACPGDRVARSLRVPSRDRHDSDR